MRIIGLIEEKKLVEKRKEKVEEPKKETTNKKAK